jgi:hypothetical protein
MSYTIKTLRVTCVMAEGQFQGGGSAITVEGLPVAAGISKPGGADLNKAQIDISGLKYDTLDKLTTLAFRPLQTLKNKVRLEAGNKGETPHTVFEGEMIAALPVFSDSGEATLKIEAAAGYFPTQMAAKPLSVQGETTIAELMDAFAKEAGYTLKNEGVTGSVKNSVYNSSPVLKARTLARQTGIELLIDDGKFIILPAGGAIKGKIPLLDLGSGLFGYPSFTKDGVDAKCQYDPRLELGGAVEIKSIVPRASGLWKIRKLEHKLEAYKSGSGAWLTAFSAVRGG